MTQAKTGKTSSKTSGKTKAEKNGWVFVNDGLGAEKTITDHPTLPPHTKSIHTNDADETLRQLEAYEDSRPKSEE